MIRLAGAAIKRVVAGVGGSTVAVKRVMVGTGNAAVQAWSAISNMGMDKAGNFGGGTAAGYVTGWTARAGSTVTADTYLVSDGAGSKTAHWKVQLTSGAASGGQTYQLHQNGVAIATVNIPTLDTTTTFADVPITLNAGDQLAIYKSSTGTTRTVGATNTYLYWD
ncbi:hypothetical protein [Rhodococcoides fascians]|uniref:hypothetical protein n=1 Tax=Rhodococcoides fascians TaxID=1828 RepID=UPI00055CA0AA|nr:hypothetical protein [Rhodococcus fascians]